MFYALVFLALFGMMLLIVRENRRIDAEVDRIRREHARRYKADEAWGVDDYCRIEWKDDK